MTAKPIVRSVSTWSLHRTLGNAVAEDSSIVGGKFMSLPEMDSGLSLLEVIPELSHRGYESVQICHFHLALTDGSYLSEVKSTLAHHDVRLDMLLIDDGDLTAADIEPQMIWYHRWLEVAEALGAERARICAGRSNPTPELLAESGQRLKQLAVAHPEVRVVTENWMELTPDADALLAVLDSAGDDVGLLIDLANWSAPGKYEELARIAPMAEACHAKCIFDAQGPDVEDFTRTLTILRDADFSGPLAIIYDGPNDDEWAGLEREWKIVQDVWPE